MKKYCINYPCCPSCHEPLISNSTLFKVNIDDLCENCQFCEKDVSAKICPINLYKFKADSDNFFYYCPRCMTYFIDKVNLNQFTYLSNHLKECNCSSFQPLFWDVELNILEKNYIDWFLNEKTDDKYFITWPYDNINFIIILLNEILLKHPNKKILILENDYEMNLNDNKEYTGSPSLNNIIDSTYSYTVVNELSDEIDSERKKFHKKLKENLTLKSSKINYHLKFTDKTKLQNDFKEDAHFKKEKISVTSVRKKFEEIYDKGTVTNIFIDGKKKTKSTNKKGIYEVKVTTNKPEWSKIDFNSANYFNILNNYEHLSSLNELIKYQLLNEDSSVNFGNNTFFMKFDNPNKENLIKLINPDILIVKDSENTYDNKTFEDISKLVNDINSTVLFFSINKNNRLKYIEKLNSFTFQTYDNNRILAYLISKDNNKRNNVFSYKLDKKNTRNIDYNFNYVPVPILKEMDELSTQIINDIQEDVGYNKEITIFFHLMINTPMIIDKEYEYNFKYMDKNVYTWLENISDETKYMYYIDKLDEIYKNDLMDNIPLPENFVKEIKECLDENIPVYVYVPTKGDVKPIKEKIERKFKNRNLKKLVVDVLDNLSEHFIENMRLIQYKNESLYTNPLLEKIIEEIRKINESGVFIYIVSPMGYYSKSIKKEIEKRLTNQKYSNLYVGTWNDVGKVSLKYNQQLQIISTTYPYKLDLYNENFKNITFIASPKNIKNIKNNMGKKISEDSIRPMETNEKNQYPKLLHELTSVNNMEEDQEIFEIEEYIYTMENTEHKYVHSHKHIRDLKEDEKVLLLINEDNEGIFIPGKHGITYKKNESTLGTLSNKDYSNLIDKTILIDRNGFYSTYKEFFTKFMLLNGETLKFKINEHDIIGYHNLVKLANLWLDGFRNILKYESEKKPDLSKNKIKERVAKFLNNNGAEIKEISIKQFWLEEPIELETSFGTLNLYTIEHPRNYNNLCKLYKNLNEKYDGFDLNELDASNSFNAARTIQRIRSSFLKHKDIPFEYRNLYERFKYEIQNIIKNSETFKVAIYKEVTIKKEIKPYMKMKNYNQYIK